MNKHIRMTPSFSHFVFTALVALFAAIFWAPDGHAAQTGDRVILTERQQEMRDYQRRMMEENGITAERPLYVTEAQGECAECGGSASGARDQFGFMKASIIGTDERRPLTAQEEKDFSGVGRVYCENSKNQWVMGTGSLIHQGNIIVTAKHVFEAKSGDKEVHFDFKNECIFQLLDRKGHVLFTSKFVEAIFGNYAMKDELKFVPERVYNDWAVLKLEKYAPQSAKKYLFNQFGPDIFKDKVDILLPGFTTEKTLNQSLVYLSKCKTQTFEPQNFQQVLNYDCDTNHGTSGAPILYRQNNGNLMLVGIHIGTSKGMNFGLRSDGEFFNAIYHLTD